MTGELAPGEVLTWCSLAHGFLGYVFLRLSIRHGSWRLRILALKQLSHLFGATGLLSRSPSWFFWEVTLTGRGRAGRHKYAKLVPTHLFHLFHKDGWFQEFDGGATLQRIVSSGAWISRISGFFFLFWVPPHSLISIQERVLFADDATLLASGDFGTSVALDEQMEMSNRTLAMRKATNEQLASLFPLFFLSERDLDLSDGLLYAPPCPRGSAPSEQVRASDLRSKKVKTSIQFCVQRLEADQVTDLIRRKGTEFRGFLGLQRVSAPSIRFKCWIGTGVQHAVHMVLSPPFVPFIFPVSIFAKKMLLPFFGLLLYS